MLNNQVDILLKKLNQLEKYLSQQCELRQKAENKLQEVNHQNNCKLIFNFNNKYN